MKLIVIKILPIGTAIKLDINPSIWIVPNSFKVTGSKNILNCNNKNETMNNLIFTIQHTFDNRIDISYYKYCYI